MNKFKITCPICPDLLKRLKIYITDVKYIFTSDFKKENYHKHLFYSLVLTYFSMLILLKYFHLADTPVLFKIFVGGFGAYAVNFAREWYMGLKFKAPWSFTDLNMGSYGGIIGAILALLTYNIL